MRLLYVEEILKGIHYKASHILHWDAADELYDFINIWWRYRRPDSRQPDFEEWAESGVITLKLADITDPESLLRSVFGMTMRLEEHEAREFFMWENARPFDPHKKLLD